MRRFKDKRGYLKRDVGSMMFEGAADSLYGWNLPRTEITWMEGTLNVSTWSSRRIGEQATCRRSTKSRTSNPLSIKNNEIERRFMYQ